MTLFCALRCKGVWKFIAESDKSSNGWKMHELRITNIKMISLKESHFGGVTPRASFYTWTFVCTNDLPFLQRQQFAAEIILNSFRTNKLQFHPKIHSWFTEIIRCSQFETERILCCSDEKHLTARQTKANTSSCLARKYLHSSDVRFIPTNKFQLRCYHFANALSS